MHDFFLRKRVHFFLILNSVSILFIICLNKVFRPDESYFTKAISGEVHNNAERKFSQQFNKHLKTKKKINSKEILIH